MGLFVCVVAVLALGFVAETQAQFSSEDVGNVRECFGVQEVAGCNSGGNYTESGSYYGDAVSAAECFESCYSQDDCLYVAYFVSGGLCYNMAKCDEIKQGGAYTGWRFFRRLDFSGLCLATETPGSGSKSYVGGGNMNFARASSSTVGGGYENIVEGSATGATVGGGRSNTVLDSGTAATIISGGNMTVEASIGTIGGGENHSISAGAAGATIMSGHAHQASAAYASIISGQKNIVEGLASAVAGGARNTASGAYGTVAGGDANVARGDYAVLGGGMNAFITANYAAVHGGFRGRGLSRFAQVLGGSRNEVRGRFSAALGFNANVLGKYSCSMAFQGDSTCTVSQRKSIGMCADQVLFGAAGLDLVELANAKAAIGRRLADAPAAGAALLLADAIQSEADRVDQKLALLEGLVDSASRV